MLTVMKVLSALQKQKFVHKLKKFQLAKNNNKYDIKNRLLFLYHMGILFSTGNENDYYKYNKVICGKCNDKFLVSFWRLFTKKVL